jgi:hypothetical protein
MKLKNFTTNIPAVRTISEIEQLLAGMGALSIQKEYFGDGRLSITPIPPVSKGAGILGEI